ncbi:hypothetical protein JCM9533A_21770 [Catenuloplanes niger JCM 9533]
MYPCAPAGDTATNVVARTDSGVSRARVTRGLRMTGSFEWGDPRAAADACALLLVSRTALRPNRRNALHQAPDVPASLLKT